MSEREYGTVAWRASDLDALVPGWSEERRREFLDNNEDELQAAQINAGYELLWGLIEGELAMEAVADGD